MQFTVDLSVSSTMALKNKVITSLKYISRGDTKVNRLLHYS